MLVFSLVELFRPAELFYRYSIGVLQWPCWAAIAALRGQALPGVLPVRATADASDLAALPMALLALRFGWLRTRREPRATGSSLRLSGFAVVALAILQPKAARAAAPPTPTTADCFAHGAYTHDGFYLSGGLGFGALFVDSAASISNGFQQATPSSASGVIFPMIDLSIGGTLRDPRLVFGARYVMADAVEPAVSTLEHSFTTPDFRLGYQELSLFVSHYLDPHLGAHVGGSIGYFSLYAGQTQETLGDSSYPGSNQPSGVSLSFEGGQDFWIMKEVSAGITLRLAFARLSADSNTTLVLAPTVVGSLLLH